MKQKNFNYHLFLPTRKDKSTRLKIPRMVLKDRRAILPLLLIVPLVVLIAVFIVSLLIFKNLVFAVIISLIGLMVFVFAMPYFMIGVGILLLIAIIKILIIPAIFK